jgi:hypothetical protein
MSTWMRVEMAGTSWTERTEGLDTFVCSRACLSTAGMYSLVTRVLTSSRNPNPAALAPTLNLIDM